MVVGLTGMSGAGKSTATQAFAECGFHIIDCDIVARAVIIRSPCIDEVRGAFPEVFTNRIFDRKKAAKYLFSNAQKLDKYQNIVFPYVVYAIVRETNECDNHSIVLDAPTLFQSGADDFCDKIVAVTADRQTCITRIVNRDKIGEHDAVMRLNNQPDEAYFRRRCDYVIQNNGDLNELRQNIYRCEANINSVSNFRGDIACY
ncbi:MAG: dephospho-CoA kinase [Oscillospiraceae bacterium]|nr:dephospho-CoA kinase [Oscillospiraceae bacterium]